MEIRSTGALQGIATVNRLESGDMISGEACIVAVKSYDLPDVSGPAAAAAPGPCICLTNGMGLERLWGDDWGSEVEPAVLTAGFHLVHPGLVSTHPGELVVSEGGSAEGLFSRSGIRLRSVKDMETTRWAKWLVNSVINPFGALTGAVNNGLGDLGLIPWINRLFDELLPRIPPNSREFAAVEARGMLEHLLTRSGNRCSMLQDVDSGRRTEIDVLTGLPPASGGSSQGPLAGLLTALVSAMSVRF